MIIVNVMNYSVFKLFSRLVFVAIDMQTTALLMRTTTVELERDRMRDLEYNIRV